MATRAEEAYAAAEAEIARVKAAGEWKLELSSRVGFGELERLPPELADLTELRELDLTETKVRDLAPVSPLFQLENLYLYDCSVADLSPISNLRQLRNLFLDKTAIADLAPL